MLSYALQPSLIIHAHFCVVVQCAVAATRRAVGGLFKRPVKDVRGLGQIAALQSKLNSERRKETGRQTPGCLQRRLDILITDGGEMTGERRAREREKPFANKRKIDKLLAQTCDYDVASRLHSLATGERTIPLRPYCSPVRKSIPQSIRLKSNPLPSFTCNHDCSGHGFSSAIC